ncbi:MAG: membrane protein insertion efficiency factor YidD [Myxococcales bacterium]|nr:membrane protein insertion efficiency factor YidD [Myxococcales bacterium]MDH3845130.1 membrane protein insertion efficiency factor YidD [Myxococcales bacterium]
MIRAFLLFVIRLYQMTLSRLLGPTCRFEPSCSHYAATCIERFGAIRGSWLGVRRIARCHPLNPGGHDPPPQVEHRRHEAHHG